MILVPRFVFLSLLLTVLVAGDTTDRRIGEKEDEKIIFPQDAPSYHHHPLFHDQGFPPGFQHSPEFHSRNGFSRQNHSINPDDFVNELSIPKNQTMEIPIDFIQDLNKYDVSDLLLNFVDGDLDLQTQFLTSRFGDDGARNAAKMPKSAGCSPEITAVELAKSTDPSILYIPQCTKIERCSGCCSHQLLECQPVEVESIPYQVLKTKYTGAKRLKALEKEIVVVEKHISCKCGCKVKEEHCNKYQQYRKTECRCACTNTDEEKKCYKDSQKLWNPDLCACQCKDVFECTSRYFFNNQECTCTAAITKRSSSRRRIYPYENEN